MVTKVSKTVWDSAISLLQDLNPDAEMQKIKQLARVGFLCYTTPGEYITALCEQVQTIFQK